MKSFATVLSVLAFAGSAFAGVVGNINGVVDARRTFNDFASSTLNIVNNYPASVSVNESNFGVGNFANRHIFWFSDDAGSSRVDFDYADAFDLCITADLDSSDFEGREIGFQSDLFGFGFFGALPNGEIAAFGSILPFHTFGNVLPAGTPVHLRMIHRPGTGDGINPLPVGGTPSTIEYQYDSGSGWISSGQIAFNNSEGGVPETFTWNLGFGIQATGVQGVNTPNERPGSEYTARFTNIRAEIPAPGAVTAFGLLALTGLRRRR